MKELTRTTYSGRTKDLKYLNIPYLPLLLENTGNKKIPKSFFTFLTNKNIINYAKENQDFSKHIEKLLKSFKWILQKVFN